MTGLLALPVFCECPECPSVPRTASRLSVRVCVVHVCALCAGACQEYIFSLTTSWT